MPLVKAGDQLRYAEKVAATKDRDQTSERTPLSYKPAEDLDLSDTYLIVIK